MALTKLLNALNIIGQLGTTPQERGLTPQEFKDKFDEAVGIIKSYINGTLTTEIDQLISTKADKTQEAWIAPTLLNSWVNYGSPWAEAGYFKDAFGFVHLKGMIKSGTIGTVVFNLPVGYRPPAAIYLPIVSFNAFGDLSIGSDGSVNIEVGSTAWVSLNGISFRV